MTAAPWSASQRSSRLNASATSARSAAGSPYHWSSHHLATAAGPALILILNGLSVASRTAFSTGPKIGRTQRTRSCTTGWKYSSMPGTAPGGP